jgi:hypothetical protein
VTVGCESGYTNPHGGFSRLIGAGRVLIKATAWDGILGVWLKYEGAHDLKEGVNALTLQLQGPPLWRRRIVWNGETHIYHNPDVGDKQERTSPFASSHVLAWDPDVMSNAPNPVVFSYMTHVVISGASVKFDDHFVTYEFKIEVLPDGSINYDGECCFFVDGDKDDSLTKKFTGNIPGEVERTFKYEAYHDAFLDSHDYGRVVLTVKNQWAKY